MDVILWKLMIIIKTEPTKDILLLKFTLSVCCEHISNYFSALFYTFLQLFSAHNVLLFYLMFHVIYIDMYTLEKSCGGV